MLKLNPYLHFMGNTEAAFNFYKSVFGGEFETFSRFKDVPGGEKMPAEDQEKLMHVSLPLGNGNTIMATDMLTSMGQTLVAGNNFHLVIEVESEKEVDRLFGKLSAEGKVEMPPNKTFWGAYFGMCRDQFEIQWMITYTLKEK